MAKQINMELRVKDKGTPVVKKFGENTRKTMSAIAGAVGVGALTASFVSLTKKTIDYGDQLNKLNLQLGVNVTQLDKLKRVGELAGVSMAQITTSIRVMARNLNDAAQGTGLAKDALEELNINAEEFLNMNPDKAFVKIAEALTGVENPTKRAALAMEIFGRSGAVVIQMSKDLDKNLAKMNTNWTNEKAQDAADFNDELTKFRNVAEDLAIDVLPTLTRLLKDFGSTVKWIKSVFADTNKDWAIADKAFLKMSTDLEKLIKRRAELEKMGDIAGEKGRMIKGNEKAIADLTKRLAEYSAKRKEIIAEQKKEARLKSIYSPITDTRVGTVEPIDNSDMIEKLREFKRIEIEAREETERALNEARAEGWLESARMAEEALNAETERMNAEIEAEKSKIAEINKLEEEAAKQRQALIETTSQYFSDNFSDAFSDFATGTKKFEDAWRDMLASMTEDLSRMLVSSAFRQLFGLASNTGTGGGIFSAIGGFFGFANGGSVDSGKPVMVGERGPELFVPKGSGDIVPNKSLGRNVTNNINVNVSGQNGNQSQADNQRFGKIIAEQIKDQVKAVMVDEKRYGGLLNSRSY